MTQSASGRKITARPTSHITMELGPAAAASATQRRLSVVTM